ncbi:MAG: flagellar hook-associated protein FlgL [Phycisphaerae bacterium]|nr:flagellar hook-associated protein FlgL [Phycisphaerae bacterium]
MSGWGSIFNNTVTSILRHTATLANLQKQASTGLRVTRPSDDATAANRIMQLRTQTRSLDTYTANIDNVILTLEQASATVESVSTSLIRVRELATQATTGTLQQSNRDVIAKEIDGILRQVITEANHKSLGRYIFSGHKVSTSPYAVATTGGEITGVTYRGADTGLEVPVAPGVEYSGLLVGDEVFHSDSRSDPLFLGNTGARAGTGTSSVSGDVFLSLRHGNTVFQAPDHGLVKAATSDANDTIVGVHALAIASTGPGTGRLSFSGGPAANFSVGDNDVTVTTANGDVMHVDVSGWDLADATVTVVGQAVATIDDDATTTAITDFSSDVAVTNADGKVLRLDPSAINRSGLEPIRVPGTYDLFGTLIAIRDLMANDRGLTENDQIDLLLGATQSLEEVSDGIRQSATSVGARLQAMDSLRASLDDIRFATKTEADSTQEADIIAVATELSRTQTLYEMTLAASAKLLSMSLLDFLR